MGAGEDGEGIRRNVPATGKERCDNLNCPNCGRGGRIAWNYPSEYECGFCHAKLKMREEIVKAKMRIQTLAMS